MGDPAEETTGRPTARMMTKFAAESKTFLRGERVRGASRRYQENQRCNIERNSPSPRPSPEGEGEAGYRPAETQHWCCRSLVLRKAYRGFTIFCTIVLRGARASHPNVWG